VRIFDFGGQEVLNMEHLAETIEGYRNYPGWDVAGALNRDDSECA
jgi:hypothetical protein